MCPPPFETIPVEPGRPIPVFANGSTDRCVIGTPAGVIGADDKSSADPSGLGGEPPPGR